MTGAEAGKTRELIERLRIKAQMVLLGEPVAFGSDAAAMNEAADALEASLALVPVGGETPDAAMDRLGEAIGSPAYLAGYELGAADARVDAARAALAGSVVEPGGMREGWQWVPVEPTEEMLNKGLFSGAYLRNEIHAYEDPAKGYAAMLAAAPAPPTLVPQQPAEEEIESWGADALKWAQGFRRTALRLGYSDMDEGWLIGWFANAIERADMARHPAAPPSSERAGLKPVVLTPHQKAFPDFIPWSTDKAVYQQQLASKLLDLAPSAKHADYGMDITDVMRRAATILATPPAHSGLDPATIEACALIADYAIERAKRDWNDPVKQEAVADVAAEIAAAIRALAQEGS